MLLILAKFIFKNLIIFLIFYFLIRHIRNKLKSLHLSNHGKHTKVLTFIHPNCYDFGGGEKVLWMIINALTNIKKHNTFYKINILCAPKLNKDQNKDQDIPYNQFFLNRLKERFSITINNNNDAIKEIEMIEFKTAKYLSPFPYFTMFLQIIFQIVFAIEICSRVYSDYMIDTTGLPFIYSILNYLGNYKLFAYVHYPFISQDMINDIKQGRDGVHSRGLLAKYKIYKKTKLLYYTLILKFYKFNCSLLSFIFTNSTWTFEHLNNIVPEIQNVILYPPCSIGFYRTGQRNLRNENVIVSFAQFRPEKRQKMQIDILRKVREKLPAANVKLWLLGGVRNDDDKLIYDDLNNYAKNLNLLDYVQFYPNLPSTEVKKKFEMAKIGIHTMRDEHFGISVIEMMSAGLITIAHNSAGPKKDIIGIANEQVGLLSDDENDYVNQIVNVFKNYENLFRLIEYNCSKWVEKFSDESFKSNFLNICFEQKILE